MNHTIRSERSIRPPLHVLTLTPFYPSQADDAGGCFIAEPIASLAPLGITNSVLALQPWYRPAQRAKECEPAAQWLSYPSLPGGIGLPSAGGFLFARIVGRIRKLHAAQPIHVIHAHGALPCGHAAMLIARELKIPFVVSVHGLDAFSTNQVSGISGTWCRRISRRVYHSAQRVICISEHVRDAVLEGMGGNCRTSVVYNGVDPKLFSPDSADTQPGDGILSVGNLIPIKGHDLLIRAVASLANEFADISLDIIGEGSEKARLQSLARQSGISSRVHFRGRQSRHEVANAMKRCAFFVLPSRYEGLGCVYLEAMSCAKTVIGCRGQGIAEILQQGTNGFLVGPDNERELSLVMGILLGDPAKRGLIGTAARDTILDRLTLDHQAKHLVRIYRELSAQ